MSGYTLHGAYSLDDLLAFGKILPEKEYSLGLLM